MSQRIQDALEQCLATMSRGADLESALAQFPELEPELRPLLEAAQAARSLAASDVVPHVATRSRMVILSRAVELRRPALRTQRFQRLAFALAALLVFFLTGGGLLSASAQALPGDLLYPVKRAAEDLRVQLLPNGAARDRLEDQYEQRRTAEVTVLLEMARVESVSFEGPVVSISGDRWMVGDVSVQVNAQARLIGQIGVGMTVEVEGTTQTEEQVLAQLIRLRAFDFTGVIQDIQPEHWTIAGTLVHIRETTRLEEGLRVGDMVHVHSHAEDAGQLVAREIGRLEETFDHPTETEPPEGTPVGEHTSDRIEFSGLLETASGPSWIIAGTAVVVDSDTDIEGNPLPGDLVEVRASRLADGTLVAEQIRARAREATPAPDRTEAPEASDAPRSSQESQDGEHVEIEGVVESIGPDGWIIGGTQVLVTGQTEIRGELAVGDAVHVRAVTQANGQIVAERIERQGD